MPMVVGWFVVMLALWWLLLLMAKVFGTDRLMIVVGLLKEVVLLVDESRG